MYLTFEYIHIFTVFLSLSLFVLRGVWMLADSAQLQRRWVRIVPHVIDTILLLSAIVLMVLIRQYPFVDAWLTAKLLGVLLYIGLGMIALKYGRSLPVRAAAWVAALLTFGYIVAVALSHDYLPWRG